MLSGSVRKKVDLIAHVVDYQLGAHALTAQSLTVSKYISTMIKPTAPLRTSKYFTNRLAFPFLFTMRIFPGGLAFQASAIGVVKT